METRTYRIEWRDGHGVKRTPVLVQAATADEARNKFHAESPRGAYFESSSVVIDAEIQG